MGTPGAHSCNHNSNTSLPKSVKLNFSLCDAIFLALNLSQTTSKNLKRGTCPNFNSSISSKTHLLCFLPSSMLTLTSPSNNRKRSSSGGRGGRATGNGGGGGASSSTSSYQLLPVVIVDPSRFDTMREWGRGGWVCVVGWFLVSVIYFSL